MENGQASDQTLHKIQGRLVAQIRVGIGEPPPAAVVNRGENVGFLPFQRIGNKLDVELKAFPGAIEFIALRMRILSFRPMAPEDHPGTPQDLVDSGRRNFKTPPEQMPSG